METSDERELAVELAEVRDSMAKAGLDYRAGLLTRAIVYIEVTRSLRLLGPATTQVMEVLAKVVEVCDDFGDDEKYVGFCVGSYEEELAMDVARAAVAEHKGA